MKLTSPRFLIAVLLAFCGNANWVSASNDWQSNEGLVSGASPLAVKLVDGKETCWGIRLGRGGWVLTNLHCLERSLTDQGLLEIERLPLDVRYRRVRSSGWKRFVELPKVSFPGVVDPGAFEGWEGASVQLWATGYGYPVLADVLRAMNAAPKFPSLELINEWVIAGTVMPLEDFAVLRVRGLREERSCATFEGVSTDSVPSGAKLSLALDGEEVTGTASLGRPTNASQLPGWHPFWAYTKVSGVVFSSLPTTPGHSGAPVMSPLLGPDQEARIVAMHSFGAPEPRLSAEHSLFAISSSLGVRYPWLFKNCDSAPPSPR